VRSDRLRLLDAIEQIDLVQKFAQAGRETFASDPLVQSAILHRLALLGEACRGLSDELCAAHPEVPWRQIIAFRNILIHEYFGVDLDLAWAIVTEHLNPIRLALCSIAQSLPDGPAAQ
jgi:uncharacterized protein with HEPN domain